VEKITAREPITVAMTLRKTPRPSGMKVKSPKTPPEHYYGGSTGGYRKEDG
jgi:hypothetical protein